EDACPTTAIEVIGEEWDVQPLVDELIRDKVFFETSNGGVTLSGGEALYQLEFAIEVAEGLKSHGVHVALDTCGYSSKKAFERILHFVDLVLYDLKQMNEALHLEYTGVPLETVLSNARTLASSGIPVWVRTPIIPGFTDSEDNIRKISRFIIDDMNGVVRYDLLAFNNLCIDKYALLGQEFPLKKTPLVTKKTMEALAEVARTEGVQNVHWSGMTRREEDLKTNP
ncbi:MAG: glycyl-radical enzyme activating protein, partial [Candidatus Thorarchaeota archaeon]